MAKRKCNKLEGLPSRPPGDSSKVPFTQLCAWIFRSGTTFGVVDDELRVKMGDGAPTWLKGVIDAHAPKLLRLARCQELDAHIEYRLRQLGPPYTMTFIRSAHAYLSTQLAKFVMLSGSEIGYDDPGNIFAWNCIESYREQLAAFSNL